MNWESSSEIVAGLIIEGKCAPHSVRKDMFFPPYDEIVARIQKGDCIEDVITKVGINPIQVAKEASHSLNGLSSANWVKILEDTAISFTSGTKLRKFGEKLEKGEEVDWSQVNFIASRAMENIGGNFTPMSDIEAMEVPFKKTGFRPIDDHLGGLPQVGQVVLAASPGTGKTTLMANLAGCWIKEHPGERIAIFTLEMMASELKMRFNEVVKLSKEEMERLLINDEPFLTPEDIIAKASTIENLGLVCIDFADLLVKGESSESSVAIIYRTFMLGAKKLGCPIVLLSQLSRSYDGGLPRPFHIRYTGLAEALAWMILMLYNPNNDWFKEGDEEILPAVEGRAYMLCWKCRGGFRIHDAPGAIQIPYKGNKGWRYDVPGKWFSLSKVL